MAAGRKRAHRQDLGERRESRRAPARWSGDGPLRARAGRASYATYYLHPLVLTAIMVLFAPLPLAPELTFLAVALLAVPVCFLAGYAATRVPGISKVL